MKDTAFIKMSVGCSDEVKDSLPNSPAKKKKEKMRKADETRLAKYS